MKLLIHSWSIVTLVQKEASNDLILYTNCSSKETKSFKVHCNFMDFNASIPIIATTRNQWKRIQILWKNIPGLKPFSSPLECVFATMLPSFVISRVCLLFSWTPDLSKIIRKITQSRHMKWPKGINTVTLQLIGCMSTHLHWSLRKAFPHFEVQVYRQYHLVLWSLFLQHLYILVSQAVIRHGDLSKLYIIFPRQYRPLSRYQFAMYRFASEFVKSN